MDAAFCLGAAPPHSSLFQMSGVLTARRRDLSVHLGSVEGRLTTHCCRFPHDNGWTAIDPNRTLGVGAQQAPGA